MIPLATHLWFRWLAIWSVLFERATNPWRISESFRRKVFLFNSFEPTEPRAPFCSERSPIQDRPLWVRSVSPPDTKE